MRKITIWLWIWVFLAIVAIIIILILQRFLGDVSWPDIIKTLPNLFIGFSGILLSIIILWYNFSREPEIRILRVIVYPENNQNLVAESQYIKPVIFRDQVLQLVEPVAIKKNGKKYWKIQCKELPTSLRFLFDVANFGKTGTTVHDYSYKLLIGSDTIADSRVAMFPHSYFHIGEVKQKQQDITYVEHGNRMFLEAQARVTNVFEVVLGHIPIDGEVYMLQVNVHAGTYSKSVCKLSIELIFNETNENPTILWGRN